MFYGTSNQYSVCWLLRCWKNHLATAIGIEAARDRYSTYFVTFEAPMIQLKKALQENHLAQRMKFFSKYKVSIIDEIGYM